jgi:hypothetical protein
VERNLGADAVEETENAETVTAPEAEAKPIPEASPDIPEAQTEEASQKQEA